jgi:hypothetical protein
VNGSFRSVSIRGPRHSVIRIGDCRIRTLVVALAITALMARCANGPGASHYGAVLDELTIPAGWELADTVVSEPGGKVPCETILGSCPAVLRYYLVSGQPAGAFSEIKEMVTDAGFELTEVLEPGCPGLRANDRLACYLIAIRGPDLLNIHVYKPGIDPDELGIAREGHFVVLLRTYAKPAKAPT